MEFLELAKKRYSVREFENKPVEKEKLDKILEAGRIAPTACNFQPQRILVIQDKEQIEKLKKSTRFTFDAPVILMICADTTKSWTRKYDNKNHADIDVSIVTTHMMLQAAELGIGTTWVCSFNPQQIKEDFYVPEGYEVINLLPMGYPKKGNIANQMHNDRLEINKTVFYNQFK